MNSYLRTWAYFVAQVRLAFFEYRGDASSDARLVAGTGGYGCEQPEARQYMQAQCRLAYPDDEYAADRGWV